MPDRKQLLRGLLERNGYEEHLADALLRVDTVAMAWRRRLHKRELGARAIEALSLDIDLAQLDVLFAIAASHLPPDLGGDGETMVSSVAERLLIDPSRASRVVAEMVNAGYARRAVSQKDARRTIIELTAAGQAVVDAVHGYKWLLLATFFEGWDKKELETFVPMFERYAEWMSSAAGDHDLGDKVDDLAAKVRAARAKTGSGRKSG